MTEIIEGVARDVTPASTALTVAPASAPIAHYDAPTQDPLRALGLMSAEDFQREVQVIKAGKERMLALQAGLLRGPEYDADGKKVKDGPDWDTIPGTPKPSLLQPGAESLAMFHRLVPEHIQRLIVTPPSQDGWPEEVAVHTETRLHHGSLEGPIVGTAVASCSSYEDRYLYRNTERTCPKCGAATIIKGKPEFAPRQGGKGTPVLPGYEQGGWVCWGKKGGCNANFTDADQAILGQAIGKAFVDNPRGLINTITQISAKRGFVGAIRHTLNITDLFTQDIEDILSGAIDVTPPPAQQAQQQAQAPAAQQAAPKQQAAAQKPATAAPKAQGDKALVFEGPVTVPPDGTRQTAKGRVANFAIKVGNSKHNVELWDEDAERIVAFGLEEGHVLRVHGVREEQDYPNRGDKPKKKVIKDVTLVEFQRSEGDWSAILSTGPIERSGPVVSPSQTPPDEGPPAFDDDDLPFTAAPVRQQLTGDPKGTAEVFGELVDLRWDQTPKGVPFLYVEIEPNPGTYVKAAMGKEDAEMQGAQDIAIHSRVRLIGGWNGRGEIVVATILGVVP